jgi:hypothetical protein
MSALIFADNLTNGLYGDPNIHRHRQTKLIV